MTWQIMAALGCILVVVLAFIGGLIWARQHQRIEQLELMIDDIAVGEPTKEAHRNEHSRIINMPTDTITNKLAQGRAASALWKRVKKEL